MHFQDMKINVPLYPVGTEIMEGVVEDDHDLYALRFLILTDSLFAFNKCCDPLGRILGHNISFFQYGLFLDTKLCRR